MEDSADYRPVVSQLTSVLLNKGLGDGNVTLCDVESRGQGGKIALSNVRDVTFSGINEEQQREIVGYLNQHYKQFGTTQTLADFKRDNPGVTNVGDDSAVIIPVAVLKEMDRLSERSENLGALLEANASPGFGPYHGKIYIEKQGTPNFDQMQQDVARHNIPGIRSIDDGNALEMTEEGARILQDRMTGRGKASEALSHQTQAGVAAPQQQNPFSSLNIPSSVIACFATMNGGQDCAGEQAPAGNGQARSNQSGVGI